MEQIRKIAAGFLSALLLMQGAGTLPRQQTASASTASAAYIQTIRTVAYTYDFGAFKAIYNTKQKKWFTESGAQIDSVTEAVQTLTASDDSSLKLTLHFDTQQAEIASGGTVTDCTALFQELLFAPLNELVPEYDKQTFYDKAQQKEVPLPKPETFPLTYICDTEFQNGTPASLRCRILFGSYEYGFCNISVDGGLFRENAEGSVQIQTVPKLAVNTAATPYTVSGDVNLDCVLDVSDAVMTCRIVSEDKFARITDLGMTLADQNTDDRIDSADITDTLNEIAGVPYENRVPEGTVPVVALDYCDAEMFDKIFGADVLKDDVRSYTTVYPNDDFDTWYFAWAYRTGVLWPNYGGSQRSYDPRSREAVRFLVRSLMLTADGYLRITADIWDPEFWTSSETQIIMFSVTVPAGTMEGDVLGAWETNSVQSMPQYSPDIRYIPRESLPDGAIRLLGIERIGVAAEPEAFSQMAKTFGYSSGDEIREMYEAQGTEQKKLAACRENGKTDIWDFALLGAGAYGLWNNFKVDNLFLMNENCLDITVTLWQDAGCADGQGEILWFSITVPHGSLPADLTTDWSAVIQDPASESYVDPPAMRYITVYRNDSVNLPECCSEFESGLLNDNRDTYYPYNPWVTEEGTQIVPDEIIRELSDNDIRYTCRFYTRETADTAPFTELRNWLLDMYDILCIYFRTPVSGEGGYYNEFRMESARITGTVLNLQIAEYRPVAKEGIPEHYDRMVIRLPRNLYDYAGITDVRIRLDPYYDSIRHCTADGEYRPAADAVRGEDGLWHWDEEDMLLDDFLAAAHSQFYIEGDVPELYSAVSGSVNVSVIDLMTGQPVPGFGLELYGPYIYETAWDTGTEPQHVDIDAVMSNYGFEWKFGLRYRILTTSAPEGYEKPEQYEFELPENGEPLEIILYTYPTDQQENVHFSVYDRSRRCDATRDYEISARGCICIYDAEGHQLYFASMYFRQDFLLPDGTYTAKLLYDENGGYTFADPAIYGDAVSGSDTIVFTVKDGVPDREMYTFDLMEIPDPYADDEPYPAGTADDSDRGDSVL